MRLINADELLKRGINLSWSVQKRVSEVDIGLMPTVEVVRCKDCKYRPYLSPDKTLFLTPTTKKGCDDFTCPYTCPDDDYYNRMPDDDDFCSSGERK